MGYYITHEGGRFKIKAENKAAALKALKEYTDDSSSWVTDSAVQNAKTLEDAMVEWRWQPDTTEREMEVADLNDDTVFDFEAPDIKHDNKDITSIWFEGEKLGDDEEFFGVLAPFVENGSYIEMRGEENAHWKWVFKDGECIEIGGSVIFSDTLDDIKNAMGQLINSADDTGCSEGLTVVSSETLGRLADIIGDNI